MSTLARQAAHLRYRIGTLSPIDPSDLEPDRVDVLHICAHTTVCKRNLEMRARSARKIFSPDTSLGRPGHRFFPLLDTPPAQIFWPDGQKIIKAPVCSTAEIRPLNVENIYDTERQPKSAQPCCRRHSGVLGRMIVDGSSGGRPRGRRTKVIRQSRDPYYFRAFR